jgi:hypothetical protein
VHGEALAISAIDLEINVTSSIGLWRTSGGFCSIDTNRVDVMEKGGDTGGSAANNSSDFVSF